MNKYPNHKKQILLVKPNENELNDDEEIEVIKSEFLLSQEDAFDGPLDSNRGLLIDRNFQNEHGIKKDL